MAIRSFLGVVIRAAPVAVGPLRSSTKRDCGVVAVRHAASRRQPPRVIMPLRAFGNGDDNMAAMGIERKKKQGSDFTETATFKKLSSLAGWAKREEKAGSVVDALRGEKERKQRQASNDAFLDKLRDAERRDNEKLALEPPEPPEPEPGPSTAREIAEAREAALRERETAAAVARGKPKRRLSHQQLEAATDLFWTFDVRPARTTRQSARIHSEGRARSRTRARAHAAAHVYATQRRRSGVRLPHVRPGGSVV